MVVSNLVSLTERASSAIFLAQRFIFDRLPKGDAPPPPATLTEAEVTSLSFVYLGSHEM